MFYCFYLLQSPKQAADTILYATLKDEFESHPSVYVDNCKAATSAAFTYDEKFQVLFGAALQLA